MKFVFFFMLQAPFVFDMFNFFDFLVKKQNGLIRKLLLFSKFMTLQTRQQIMTIPISPNISSSKGKHTMKFGQLIECNMRNRFLEKS